MTRKLIVLNKQDTFCTSIFFLFLYLNFVANFTMYSDLITVVFIGVTAYFCFIKRKVYFSFCFFIDLVFIAYSIYQIRSGIAVYPSMSQTMVNTLIKCVIINWATVSFIVLTNNINKVLTIYVYAMFSGVITFFIIGWRTLLKGRFLQDTTVNFLGAKVSIHSNTVGLVAAFAFVFAIFLFFDKDKRKCLFICSLLLMCILLTGSRKSIILAAAGLIVLMKYMNPNMKFGKVIIATIIISVGYVVLMKIPFIYDIAGSRIESTFHYYSTGTTQESSMLTRNRLIEVGLKYYDKRPATGYGLDNYRIIANNSDLYAHNNFIEILFSSGMIGFYIYYSKYVFLFVSQLTLKIKKEDQYFITARLLLCLFIIFTVFEYWVVSYYERKFMIIHMFILGFLQIYKNNLVKNEANVTH